jgi:16S rRNA (guanine527-N7)-methyltransferase
VTGKAELLEAARSLLGLELTAAQRKDFDWYATELVDWNQRFNLTAITDPAAIGIKHFLDSLSCLLVMRGQAPGRVIDIGTGAGFPGLPLKIVRPQIRLTLVEATGKKVDFCQHVVTSLRLEAVQVIHARAEEIGHWPDHRQAYDWALARAVAAMPVLVEYLLPLLRIGGRAIAQKGDTGPAEAHAAEKALRLLGGRVQQVVPVELPTVVESHYLVVVEKTAATPDEYPRRAGMPAKRPLA